MKTEKKSSKLYFKLWLVLAVIGAIIIMMTAEMSKYRFFGESDIYNYIFPLLIGVILILPFVIFLIKSKFKDRDKVK